MTDNQIIKAWEHCIKNNCTECLYCEFNDGHSCITKLMEDVFELYKSQRAENRKLQLENEKFEIKLKGIIESANRSTNSAMEVIKKQEAEIERLQAERMMADGYADALVEITKAEAIKEFAESVAYSIGLRRAEILHNPKELDDLIIGYNPTSFLVGYDFGMLHASNHITASGCNLVKEMVGEDNA